MIENDAAFVFGLLAVTVVLFASDRLRPDVVALLVILALILGDILPVTEAVAGFGDPLILLIAGLFVVGEGLVRTGVAYQVGVWLTRMAGSSETRLLVLLMLAVAGLGAFMSSTGVVAIFIPVVLGMTARLGISPGRLMMPLAFAALFSGMLTLIATPPNLVVNDALRNAGFQPFGFFDITPIGLLALAAGIVYMWLVGSRLLPASPPRTQLAARRHTLRELAERYDLTGQLHRLHVGMDSPLAGQTVAQAELRTRYGVTIVGIQHQRRFGESIAPALADTEFRPGDALYVVGPAAAADRLRASEGLTALIVEGSQQQNLAQELGIAEVLLPPESKLIGQNLQQAAFRSRHGLSVLGIRRGDHPLPGTLIEEKLASGDILLVAGAWKQIGRLRGDAKDFLVLNLPAELSEVAPAYRQAPFALLILLAMVVAMTLGLVHNVAAVLLAAVAMGLFRCLRMEDAYRAINWPSLVVIAGMLPLARALEQTGGVALVADGLAAWIGPLGPLALLAGIFLLAALVGAFISNTATAVLVAPIAIVTAQTLGFSPYPFAMTVAIAASAAFLTPVSSPVNTLVLAPGGYRFKDFIKVGLPLLLLVMALSLLIVPFLLPF
ncbi:MAG: SLC13 family permease [Candidatus Competibacteraceae bacterium]|nr:MAG: SLC13 family permease [Candidatus Competibacteraceae bacterium]